MFRLCSSFGAQGRHQMRAEGMPHVMKAKVLDVRRLTNLLERVVHRRFANRLAPTRDHRIDDSIATLDLPLPCR